MPGGYFDYKLDGESFSMPWNDPNTAPTSADLEDFAYKYKHRTILDKMQEPLTTFPSRLLSTPAEALYKSGESKELADTALGSVRRGAGAYTESMGNTLDQLSSPLNIALTLATGGTGLAGRLGTASRVVAGGAGAGQVAHGLYGLSKAEKGEDYANSGLETVLGLAGLRGAWKGRTPTPERPTPPPPPPPDPGEAIGPRVRQPGYGRVPRDSGPTITQEPPFTVTSEPIRPQTRTGPVYSGGEVQPRLGNISPRQLPGETPRTTRSMSTERGLPPSSQGARWQAPGVREGELLGLPENAGPDGPSPEFPAGRAEGNQLVSTDPRTFYFGRRGLSTNLGDVTDVARSPRTPAEAAQNALIPERYKSGVSESNIGPVGAYGYEPPAPTGANIPPVQGTTLRENMPPAARSRLGRFPSPATTGLESMPDVEVSRMAQLGDTRAVRELQARAKSGATVPERQAPPTDFSGRTSSLFKGNYPPPQRTPYSGAAPLGDVGPVGSAPIGQAPPVVPAVEPPVQAPPIRPRVVRPRPVQPRPVQPPIVQQPPVDINAPLTQAPPLGAVGTREPELPPQPVKIPAKKAIDSWRRDQIGRGSRPGEVDAAIRQAVDLGINPLESDNLAILGDKVNQKIRGEQPPTAQPTTKAKKPLSPEAKDVVDNLMGGKEAKLNPKFEALTDADINKLAAGGNKEATVEMLQRALKRVQGKKMSPIERFLKEEKGELDISALGEGIKKVGEKVKGGINKLREADWSEVPRDAFIPGINRLEAMGPRGRFLADTIKRTQVEEDMLAAQKIKRGVDPKVAEKFAREEVRGKWYGEDLEKLKDMIRVSEDPVGAKRVTDQYFGRKQKGGSKKFTRGVEAFNQFQAATNLSQFRLSNVPNWSSNFLFGNWGVVGKETARALGDILKEGKIKGTEYGKMKSTAMDTGALQPVMAEMNSEMVNRGGAVKGRPSLDKLYGISGSEEWQRTVSANIGKKTAEQLFETLKKSPENVRQRARLSNLLPRENMDKVMNQTALSEDQLNIAGNRMAALTQGRATSVDLPPLWSDHSGMNLVTQFKRFATLQTSNLLKAYRIDPWRTAAALATVFPVMGEAIGDAKAVIKGSVKGAVSKESIMDEIKKALIDRGSDWHRLINDYSQGWAFGIMGDAVGASQRGESGLSNFVAGPTIQAASRIIGNIATGNPRGVARQVAEKIPIAGQGISSAMRKDSGGTNRNRGRAYSGRSRGR